MRLKISVLITLIVAGVFCFLTGGCSKTPKQSSEEDKSAGAREKEQPKAAFTAKSFDLSQVRLLDGPFKDAMERDRRYLYQLEPDRFLHTFRLNAGLESTAKPYGGWESPDVELRGHSIGHYLSACSMMYASTGDEELKKRCEYIVAELAKCQKSLGSSGYLSAFPESFIDRVVAGQPVWAPWYTLHKIYAGLIDTYLYCDNEQALEVVKGMASWAKGRSDKLSDEQFQRMLGNEFGGMNEAFANLYAITGEAEHLELARRFDHGVIFEPLAEGRDSLRGLHSNTQIPKIIGAAREYELTGEKRYYDIASFFWDTVTSCRMYSIGGTSNYESWRTPPCVLAGELSVESAESCCTYNMLKLTKHLFQLSGDIKYADYYERALFDHILASQSPENGMMMYYIAMKPGHFKVFSRPFDSFWCCVGTGMENHAKYGESIYFYDDEGLFVNLFIASELDWRQKGMVIRQETRFPEEDITRLKIEARRRVPAAIRIRVPYWASEGVSVRINGKVQPIRAEAGSYLRLERSWRNGDVIEVTMPMSLHLHRMPDDEKMVSIMYGPLVLAAELGTEKLTEEMQYVSNQRSQHNAPAIEVPQIVADVNDMLMSINAVDGESLTFRTDGIGRPEDITLVPFYKLYGQRYNLYFKIYTPEEYEKIIDEQRRIKERQEAEAKARQEKIQQRQVDFVRIGDAVSEQEHKMQSEGSYSGMHQQRYWRDARNGGWFSYEMRVLADVPMILECTYWGGDIGRRFKIYVDGALLADVRITDENRDRFYEEQYEIPFELTKDKETVTVKFMAPEGGFAGGVFGLMMFK